MPAFEKNRASVNTTDTDGTAKSGKRNDTATPQSSAANIGNNSETSKSLGSKVTENQPETLLDKAEKVSRGIDPRLMFRDTIEDDDTAR